METRAEAEQRRLREGDTVFVWKLDRPSRSRKDLLHIMERIDRAGSGCRSIIEAVDTATPAGRMMVQMVGASGLNGRKSGVDMARLHNKHQPADRLTHIAAHRIDLA